MFVFCFVSLRFCFVLSWFVVWWVVVGLRLGLFFSFSSFFSYTHSLTHSLNQSINLSFRGSIQTFEPPATKKNSEYPLTFCSAQTHSLYGPLENLECMLEAFRAEVEAWANKPK